jgi:hypothetical protein
MGTLAVTAKEKVTLGKDILKHRGVQPGGKITVDKLPNGRIELKAARPTGKISDVLGFLKRKDGPSLSIEEMSISIKKT